MSRDAVEVALTPSQRLKVAAPSLLLFGLGLVISPVLGTWFPAILTGAVLLVALWWYRRSRSFRWIVDADTLTTVGRRATSTFDRRDILAIGWAPWRGARHPAVLLRSAPDPIVIPWAMSRRTLDDFLERVGKTGLPARAAELRSAQRPDH
jgi:hypothetical protein